MTPDAPIADVLRAAGDVHRHVVVPPPDTRSLTYRVALDPEAASVVSQVWHRGVLVDEARAEALGEPRTLGVVPGRRFGFVLTSVNHPVSYRLSVSFGEEAWEIEPNHGDDAVNLLPAGLPLHGHLHDDDRFVVHPGPGTGELTFTLDIDDGAAWLALAWRGGELFEPRIVQERHRATVGAVPDEPVTVLLRPLFGEPDYRLRVDEAPAPALQEPNDQAADASPLPIGQLVTGGLAGGVDHLVVPALRSPHRIVVERVEGGRGPLSVRVRRGEQLLFDHRGRRSAALLDPGPPVTVEVRGQAPYTVMVAPRG